ncbi:MAG: spermidine/putrescine ABC transporter substrate-binding protein [Actinobacteria bacterium]|nr:spermidine/putrescine ABC transporter substrate-binding protein [Actinomycetota bacterium]
MRKLIALGALLALLLAACSGGATSVEEQAGGGGDAAAQPSASEAAGSEAAPDSETVSCEPGETDGELVLYNWTEYIDPELVTKFTEEFGVDVIEDFYPSNEEMLARVQGGGSGFDVVVPSDYMVGIMIDQGLLMQLDKSAIPNADNVAEDFTSPPFDPELAFSMPYQWGTTGIGLNTTETAEDPEATWGWIFDPEKADGLDGQISMLDDPREAMAAALSYLGHPINSTDEAQLQEAADLIAETTDRLAAFDSDQYEDLLISGETAVAHGYSGDFFAAFDEAEDGDNFTYVIPEEGAVRWVDNMAILADAPHPCTAHTFLNFMLDARNGAQLTNWNYYGSPNSAAEEFIDAEVLEDPAIYPPEDVLENLQFIEDTGDAETLYTDLFTQAKS